MKKLLALAASLLLVVSFATPAQSAGAKYSVYQKTLSTFSSTATSLTSQQRAQVKAAVDANPYAEKFICTGIRYYSQPMSVNIMVRKRAKAACEYAKKLNPELSTWYQNKPTQARSYAGRVLLTVKSALPETVASPAGIEVCQIPDGRPASQKQLPPGLPSLGSIGMSNIGFPLSPDLIPATGVANLVVVPVSFSDLKGVPSNPDSYLDTQLQKMSDWATYWSQGKLTLEFQQVRGWQELSQTAEYFAIDDKPRGNRQVSVYVELAEAIAAKVPSEVDWQKAHGLLVLFPQTITTISNDWGGRGDLINTPDGARNLFFWGGGRWHNQSSGSQLSASVKQELLWSFWLHELMHSQGLSLHAPGNGFGIGIGQNQYPAYGKFSGAISAWEQFLLGWLEDKQVACIDAQAGASTNTVLLTPLEIDGNGRKAAVIRTGEHSGLVIESRRPVGYSSSWSNADRGLLVYQINTTLMNDRSGEGGADCGNSRNWAKWGYLLGPKGTNPSDNECSFEKFLVKESDSVVFDNVSITLEQAFGTFDEVAVTIGSMSSQGLPEQTSLDADFDLLSREPEGLKFCGCCGCFPGANLH